MRAVNKYVSTTREIVRHVLGRIGLHSALLAWRRTRGLNVNYLYSHSRGEAFQRIYKDKIWTLGQPNTPLSGSGSSLDATTDIRHDLPVILDKIVCKTLLDVGCGDQAWISSLELEQKYIGIDVVSSVIEENRRRYPGPRSEYYCLDAVTDELPDADTALCREVLFHLSFADGLDLVRNLARKQRKYLIATTDRTTLFNADVRSGDFRILNLTRGPFRFPKPDFAIDDAGVMPGRQLAVWRFDRLSHLSGRGWP